MAYKEDWMKPQRGTPTHVDWVVQQVISASQHLNIPVNALTRDSFIEATKGWVSNRDLAAAHGWHVVRAKAAAKSAENRFVQAPTSFPLPAIPEGQYYAKRISSELDENGAVTKQWVECSTKQAPGELTSQLPQGHKIAGVSTLVSGDGHTLAQWIKTKEEYESREEALARLIRELPPQVPVREGSIEAPPGPLASDLLAVYPMGDPHIGMLSWAPETGESFDLKKAQHIMCSAMKDLVLRGPKTEKALVINLGDFFHADSQDNKTARSGNALDVDGRWPKVIQVGLEIMIFMVDQALMHHKEVTVVNEIGNHDDHSAIFLSIALRAYYSNEPRVHVDMSPSRFHWCRFGKNLIGITHGHNQKHGELEAIMAADRPEDWGATLHRFWYCGHIHHTVKKEMRGCIIESFRTLAARDAWAANVGYRAGRDMNRITLHREYGEVGRDTVNAAYLQACYREE